MFNKKSMHKVGVLLVASFLPLISSAQGGLATSADGGPFGDLLTNVLVFINDIVIPFIIGIGFLFFVWGMFKYFILGGANDEAKEQGKSLVIYATLGFVLIIIFWGVVNLVTDTTGFAGEGLENIPSIFPGS